MFDGWADADVNPLGDLDVHPHVPYARDHRVPPRDPRSIIVTASIPRIVSADDHIVEPPDIWVTRLPKRFRDAGPRIEQLPTGSWRSSMGEHLARLEMRIVLEEVVSRLRDLRLVERTDPRYSSGQSRGLHDLHVTFANK